MKSKDVITDRCLLNHTDREALGGKGGGAGIITCCRAGVSAVQSAFSQVGEAAAGRKRGAEKASIIGIWSDPVLGRWVDHEVKKGASLVLTKARLRTAGLSLSTKGKWLYTPGVFSKENPISAALSK